MGEIGYTLHLEEYSIIWNRLIEYCSGIARPAVTQLTARRHKDKHRRPAGFARFTRLPRLARFTRLTRLARFTRLTRLAAVSAFAAFSTVTAFARAIDRLREDGLLN